MTRLLVSPGPFNVPHSEATIRELLQDLFVEPRRAVYKWSKITAQTAQVRLAYIGQHLASVVTGIQGAGTAARGDDLQDGSEVKSCSRADQLGDCRKCGHGVLASFDACPQCGSTDIDRKTDSHWIFAIKTDLELKFLLQKVPRIVLALFDRPPGTTNIIQTRVWEVWPRSNRNRYFAQFLIDYYENNYVPKIKKGLTPAPCNLHPLKYDFYLMNPIPIFRAMIKELADEGVEISIQLQIPPDADRAGLPSELMPTNICKPIELVKIIQTEGEKGLLRLVARKNQTAARQLIESIKSGKVSREDSRRLSELIPLLDEPARRGLIMRRKRIKQTPSTYRRR